MTRPERLNNPGAIRRSKTTHWLGAAEIQADPDFVTFRAPEWGLRAIIRILDSYQRDRVQTIREAISRWSPPSDNNPTEIYVQNVAHVCCVDPDAPVLLSQYIQPIVKAIVTQECGGWPYTDELLAQALELAREAV